MRWSATRALWTGISVLLLTAASPVDGEPRQGWTFLERTDGVSLWKRDKAPSDSPQLKATTTLPYSVGKVAGALTDIPSHVHFVPHVKSVAILERKTLKTGVVRQLIYQVNALPIVSDRDLLITTDTWKEEATTGTAWFSTWKNADNRRYPPREGLVRIPLVEGAWSVSPTGDGTRAKVVYIIHTEVGGSIPTALTIPGQQDAAIEFLANLSRHCRALYGPPTNEN